jgi:hypothetical protein
VISLFGKTGKEFGQIKNGKLLPHGIEYDYPIRHHRGTIGQPTNGYQVVEDGDNFYIRRIPDQSGYTASQLTELTQHPNAHVLDRHGPDVTDEALIKRANEGIAPDGSYIGYDENIGYNPVNPPKPPYSSKFESQAQVIAALNNTRPGTTAFNSVQASNGRKTVVHQLTDGSTYGKGVPKDGNSFRQSTKVRAGYQEVSPGNWQLVTMFPDF